MRHQNTGWPQNRTHDIARLNKELFEGAGDACINEFLGEFSFRFL